MTVLTEQNHTAEFLISDDPHMRSRDTAQVTAPTDFDLLPGAVLGKKTADGVYHEYDPAAADGTETVAAVLFEGVPKGTTASRTIVSRSCQVKASKLAWLDGATAPQITTGTAALEALGIVVR